MTILYFSATGNSLSVAKRMGGTLKSIPELERTEKYVIQDDVIGIVSPIYHATLPLLVAHYLSKTKLQAKYIFGILTYGCMNGAATNRLHDVLTKNGSSLDYVTDLLMVDIYLPGFKIEDELEQLPRKNIDAQFAKIKKEIENHTHKLPQGSLLGRVMTGIMGRKMESDEGILAIQKTDKKFTITEKCTGCGVCSSICPVSNIVMKDIPRFQHHCESCFACIHNCPAGAIHLENQKSAIRFRNPEITLQELIAGNGSVIPTNFSSF